MIKSDWESLLRAEPTRSPLGQPDTLVFLMDETLTRLCEGLRDQSEPSWKTPHQQHLRLSPFSCSCDLNPLLTYFATGELAVRSALLGKTNERELEEVLLIFHALAQQEINTMCSICRQRPRAHCQREDILKVAINH